MWRENVPLKEIIDLNKLDSLFLNFSKATNISVGLLKYPSQEIILMHGNKDVCSKFHWEHPDSKALCRVSHIDNTSRLHMPGDTFIGHCPNGMAQGCTPININGQHIATIFIDQVFFEKPDLAKFKERAKRFNYDVDDYLQAIKQIPIMSEQQFKAYLDYLSELAFMIAEIGTINIKNYKKNEEIQTQKQNLKNEILSRKEAEKILKEVQIKFLAISEAAKDVIILINSNGMVTYCNPAVKNVFQYNCIDLLGRPIHKVIAPKEYHSTAEQKFNHFIKTGEGNVLDQTLELPAIRKDGSKIFIELSVSPLKLNNQWNAIAIIRDITDRKKLEIELENERNNLKNTVELKTKELKESIKKIEDTNLYLHAANNHKTRFLQSISHELRTPLNAIIGFTQLLNQQIYGELNQTQTEYLQLITESSNNLLLLINNLLNITQIDAGSLEVKLETISLDDFIKEMHSIVKPKFKLKNIEFNYIIKSPNVMIKADKIKLRQITYNLLSNACKYTHNEGKVELKVEKNCNHVKISITDTGTGIEKDNHNKIFNCFYKENTSNGQINQGAGIGLTLAKRLVEIHNGTINVDSVPGQGSHFWFTLPLED